MPRFPIRFPGSDFLIDCPFCKYDGSIISKRTRRDTPIGGPLRESDLITSVTYECSAGIKNCSVLEAYRASHKKNR